MGPGSIVLCRRRVPELLCPAVNVLVNVSSLTCPRSQPPGGSASEQSLAPFPAAGRSQKKSIPWSASLRCMAPAVWLSHQHVLV